MTGMASPEIEAQSVNLRISPCNASSEATVSHIKRSRTMPPGRCLASLDP